MRLHHLEVTAFGPFAETVAVDFDELSAAGVFLLTGATGAGKTSVLDAVCFALYGQVPGDRSGARHLRSDHAAPGVAPRVALTVSIGERTFRFARSPAWTRPKRRGTGETRVQAHVLVEELRNGDWTALTNRLDDAGLLVADLLGMTAVQFTQVAMLPQGRFQAFLRASSTERHGVLQKLFRTDRFEQVERWLVDRRGRARRAAEAAEHRVVEVLNRIQEASGADLPETCAEDLTAAAERAEIGAWADRVVAAARERHDAAGEGRAAAAASLAAADSAVAEARRVGGLQARAESAARELLALRARVDELAELRARLAAHRRAAPLEALVARAARCRRLADQAQLRWRQALAEIDDVETATTLDALSDQHRKAVAAHAVAEAFRPRSRELVTLRDRRAALVTQVTALDARRATLEQELARQPGLLDAAAVALDEARAAAAGLAVTQREVAALEDLLEASRRLDLVAHDLEGARADLARAKEAALVAREGYLGVREARINGMAAELAGALAVGCACPVCGSASHPAPARAEGAAVGRADEDTARRVAEDRAFVQQGFETRVATLTAESAVLTDRLAAVDRADLPDRLTASRSALRSARALSAEVETRDSGLRELQVRAGAAREARDRNFVDVTAARQQVDTLDAAVATLQAELDALLAGDAPDLATLIAQRRARCDRLDRAVRACAEHEDAVRSSAEADDAVASAAHDVGFSDPVRAQEALLPGPRVEAIESALTTADAARVAAEQVLAEPDIRAVATQPAPDLDVAVARQRLATETLQAAVSDLDAAATRARRLDALGTQLRSRLDDWAPLRAEHALVAGLSQLVEGKGPDNPTRIRLAAYVLSERLGQVVAAANERLSRMTGQRYSLEHTDERGAGEQRGGLSLRVRDDWSGVARDPATLSGGETFVVSLALALGLADTVAHEAGGTDIDTLFIDEGFGSLDTDTLDDVMDTLDTLRDGGRVVGLVSHVPELRSRITTQLEVVKGRTGSTLRSVLAGS